MNLSMELYVIPKSERTLALIWHRCSAEIRIHADSSPIAMDFKAMGALSDMSMTVLNGSHETIIKKWPRFRHE